MCVCGGGGGGGGGKVHARMNLIGFDSYIHSTLTVMQNTQINMQEYLLSDMVFEFCISHLLA